MDAPDLERYVYEVSVGGTGIQEYYEYSEPKPIPAVRDEWLDDVSGSWGQAMADKFADRVEVRPLWTDKTQDSNRPTRE